MNDMNEIKELNNPGPSITGFAQVFEMMLSSMQLFCRSHDFSMPEAGIILEICLYPGITSIELQRRLDLPRSTASRIIDNLVKRGLVVREVSEQDHRRVPLKLTEKMQDQLKWMVDSDAMASLLTTHFPDEKGKAAVFKLGEILSILNS